MDNFLQLFYDLLVNVPIIWDWLITPNENFLDMAPIMMILGAGAILTGIVLAIVRIF